MECAIWKTETGYQTGVVVRKNKKTVLVKVKRDAYGYIDNLMVGDDRCIQAEPRKLVVVGQEDYIIKLHREKKDVLVFS